MELGQGQAAIAEDPRTVYFGTVRRMRWQANYSVANRGSAVENAAGYKWISNMGQEPRIQESKNPRIQECITVE